MFPNTRSSMVAMTMAAVAVLAGCGSSAKNASPATDPSTAAPTTEVLPPTSTTPTTTAPVNACALMPPADAQALAGTPLDAAQPVRDTCTYGGPTSGPLAQVEVFVGDGAKKFLDIDKQLAHAFTPLTGIADEATIEDGAVFFRKGTVWVSIHLVSLDDTAAIQTRLEAAARAAVTRL